MWVIALPFLVAIADAANLIFSKFFLRRFGRLTYREFNWLAFLGIITILVLISIALDIFPSRATIIDHWVPILTLGGLGAIGNILFFRGLEQERISNVEPFIIFNPLAAILVASVFYPAERQLITYLAIFIAAGILFWAHIHGRQLRLTPGLYSIMGFWIIYGLEVALISHLLNFFDPIPLYLLRCVIIFVVLSLISKPNFRDISPKHLPMAFVLGGLAVLAVTMLYTAIKTLGIAPSLMVLVTSPMLVYWFSGAVLKERWNRRNIIAGVLIVLLVVGVSLWRLL